MQRGHVRIGPSDRLLERGRGRRIAIAERVRDLGAEACGQGSRGRHDRRSQLISPRRRPQHRDRHDRDHRCHAPAHQPVRDRRGRAGARHGEDEGEQEGGRGAREHRADDPGKQHAEGDERHRRCCEPCVARGQRRGADEHGTDECECCLGLHALAYRPAEIDQQQQGERAERRERRDVRVPDHLVPDREQDRHHDRGPCSAAQRRQAAVARREPSYEGVEPQLRSADLRTPGSASPAPAATR